MLPACRRSISATGAPSGWSLIGNMCWRKEYVRYVGEPIAAIFAESAYLAEDAAELVSSEIEELPPVLTASDEPGRFNGGRST